MISLGTPESHRTTSTIPRQSGATSIRSRIKVAPDWQYGSVSTVHEGVHHCVKSGRHAWTLAVLEMHLNGNAGQKFCDYFCSISVRALRQAAIRAARFRGFSWTTIMLWP